MALVVKIEPDEEKLKYTKIHSTYSMVLIQLIEGYKIFNNEFDKIINNINSSKILNFVKNCRRFIGEVLIFIQVVNNKKYLLLPIRKDTLLNKFDRLGTELFFLNSRKLTANRLLSQYSNVLNNFIQWFNIYIDAVDKKKESDQLIETLQESVSKAKEQAKNFESAINAINGQESEIIYSSASEKYLENARNYEVLFYLLFAGSVLITIIHLIYFPYSDINKINFIVFKILTFTVVLTLGTLFLRKAAHLRKLHDQAHQTSLELKALPLFLRNIEKTEHSEIYKKLVDKYFGKELDQTQNDKIGDLIQDQLAAGTELIRASAEMVKAKSESNSTSNN